jgi:hypothetical protein
MRQSHGNLGEDLQKAAADVFAKFMVVKERFWPCNVAARVPHLRTRSDGNNNCVNRRQFANKMRRAAAIRTCGKAELGQE